MRHHIYAILWKQLKDTLKNKEVLIQYVMFPVLTIIMENAVKLEGMPEHFFANLFAGMYLGMAPLTSIATVISEEKEKNTLRVLQMSNVRAMEYLFGNSVYIWGVCMVGSLVMGIAGGYSGRGLVLFMLLMALGHMLSMLVGAAIGVSSKSQMAATALTMPVMMVLAFLPMLSMFNTTIAKIAKLVYSQQLFLLMNQLEAPKLTTENVMILVANVLVAIVAFVFAYKKAFVGFRQTKCLKVS